MARSRRISIVLSALFAMVSCAVAPALAVDYYWSGQGDNDNWYSRHFTGQYDSEHRAIYVNNWGQIGIDPPTPGSSDDAIIDGSVTATINYTNNPSILNLFVGAPASLHVVNGGSLTVHGASIFNQGQIQIAYGGMAGGGVLQVNGATINGGGVIVFDDAGTLSGSLTLEAGNLIHGNGGHITAGMLNRGVVNADVYNSWLCLESSEKFNEGVFSASAGGRLEVRTTINQAATGLMTAGDSSTVQYYNGSLVIGGTTASSGTGKHLINGGNVTTTLTDVANTGNWLAENGSFVNLSGSTFTNNGTFEVGGYTGGAGRATLKAIANVTLEGTGDVLMNPGIVDSAEGAVLTNSSTHTIHGHGLLKAALDNQGRIIADTTGQPLSLESAAKRNAATMITTNGAYLDVKTAITQTPAGRIAAEDNSRVRYSNGSSVTGGTTASSGTGMHAITGGNVTTTLTDVTNTGNWLAENGSFVNLAGSTFTNNGTFEAGGYTGGSGWATLRAIASLTLEGTGDVLLDPGIVDSMDGAVLTNSAMHTIHGQGLLKAALDNKGLIIADVAGRSLSLESAAKMNAATMMAGNSAYLDVKTAITQSTGGQIAADDGSRVRYYNGSSVTGGTTASSGTGMHAITGGNVTTTLTDVTNTGNWLAENGSFVNLAGSTFTNNGTFEAGGYTGGSGWATIQPANDLVLKGFGTILLDPGEMNSPAPVTLTNAADHTIRGVNGRIHGNITLNNLGTIEANGGTLTVNTRPLQFSDTTLTAGTWKVTNGTLSIGGSPTVVTNNANVVLSGSSSIFAPINSLADNQGSFSILGGRTFNTAGALTSSSLLAVGANSTLAVNGDFTQTAGLTTIDGTLCATGTLSLTGGELAGIGTIKGSAVVGDGFELSPGHSAGILTFQQLLLGSGAVVNCEIDGPTADSIEITGSGSAFQLASGGTFTVDLSLLNPVGALSEYTLFHWAGDDPIFAGTTWKVTGTPGLSGEVGFRPELNSIVLTNVAIPEPASIALIGLATVGLFANRRHGHGQSRRAHPENRGNRSRCRVPLPSRQ